MLGSTHTVCMNHAIYPDLKGKFALITGASRCRGIGAATCRALATQGVNILFTTWQAYDQTQPYSVDANDPMTLEQDLLNSGVKVLHFEIDLAHPDSATKVLDAAQEWLGLPDVLVNNATTPLMTGLNYSMPASWTHTMP